MSTWLRFCLRILEVQALLWWIIEWTCTNQCNRSPIIACSFNETELLLFGKNGIFKWFRTRTRSNTRTYTRFNTRTYTRFNTETYARSNTRTYTRFNTGTFTRSNKETYISASTERPSRPPHSYFASKCLFKYYCVYNIFNQSVCSNIIVFKCIQIKVFVQLILCLQYIESKCLVWMHQHHQEMFKPKYLFK